MEKLERGYENMDHFTSSFEHERKAILKLDFTRGNYVGVYKSVKAKPLYIK